MGRGRESVIDASLTGSTADISLAVVSKSPILKPLNSLDEKLLRAWLLASEDVTDANEAELNGLVPVLVEAGYVEEKPWGDDPDSFLWSFSEAGVKRSEELEALSESAD